MSMPSDQLDPVDVRSVVEVLTAVIGADSDGAGRKRLLMNLVSALIDADRWIWVVSRFEPATGAAMALSFMQHGFTEPQVALVFEGAADPSAPPPEDARMVELSMAGRPFTRLRHELVPDEEWFTAPHFELYRKPIGTNECLYTVRPLQQGVVSGIGFHRALGKPAFSERDSLIAHIIFGAAESLHTMDMPNISGPDVMDLPPRIRTTFGLLCQGMDRKTIAKYLGVSPNTIAEYAARVYRHFGVAGQRELMRRMSRSDGGHRAP